MKEPHSTGGIGHFDSPIIALEEGCSDLAQVDKQLRYFRLSSP